MLSWILKKQRTFLGHRLTLVRRPERFETLVKTHKVSKQDAYDITSEVFKPTMDIQQEVKKTIDEKQNELIEQLQKNQKAITSGLEDVLLFNQLPDVTSQSTTSQSTKSQPITSKATNYLSVTNQ